MKKYLVSTIVLSLILASVSSALMNNGWAVANTTEVSLVRTFVSADGRQIDELVFPGKPPEVSHVTSVSVPEPHIEMGINNLSNVPAFDWCYGCSPTSAAMLFGYYDRTGYSSMYTGPTNGGMCPLDNSIWGGDECPLSATHEGIDGQSDRGHVGDYWIKYGNNGPDPYIVDGLSEHVHCACTADFMGTNQSKFGNSDGCTTFYCCTNGDPLNDYTDMEPLVRDGCHGMRLFAESRGYTVLENYSQYIKGQGSDPNRGFTFEDFMAEIDAGHPVLIHVVGHTMLGYGYNNNGNTIYIHSTWDYSDHEMTWGGTFSGAQHKMVTVIHLGGGGSQQTEPRVTTGDAVNITQTSANLMGSLQDMGTAGTVNVSFQWGTSSRFYTSETIPEAMSVTGAFDADLTVLQPNTTYYFRAKAVGNGTSYGSERQFTTLEGVIDEPPSVITDDAVNITQTSAKLAGSLQDMGTAGTVNVSFQWGTSTGSYPNETVIESLSVTGAFDADLTALQPNTTYYFRARAVGDGTVYSSERQFTTLEGVIDEPPSVTTDDAVNITQTSADLAGSLQDMGTAETVNVSFQWGTSPGSYPNETITESLSATGAFGADLTALQPNTTYYFRARAVGDGTVYGSQRQFTTLEGVIDEPPSVITDDAINITQTSASLVANLQDMGTSETVRVSFQWGTSPGSYPNETITESLSATCAFDAQLTDLQPNTTYYFRARAVGDGTVYGLGKKFKTYKTVKKSRKGDFDLDGHIRFSDFVHFADIYGSDIGYPKYNPIGDFNDDFCIDFFDFVYFARVYRTR